MVPFPISKIIQLISAIAGAVGTGLLYKGSFAYEQPGGWMDDALLTRMTERNKHRQCMQRCGLFLLMVSFVLAGASLFFE
jgi:hypothetical protein